MPIKGITALDGSEAHILLDSTGFWKEPTSWFPVNKNPWHFFLG